MRYFLAQMFGYPLKVASVTDALKIETSRALVRAALRTYPVSRLIEAVSSESGVDVRALLDRVCSRIGLTPRPEVIKPDSRIVAMVGYGPELLRSIGVIPQPDTESTAGYSLVIADPEKVAMDEFRRKGVRLFLGLGGAIERAWSLYLSEQAGEVSGGVKVAKENPIDAALIKLAEQTAGYGASEIFIGHPDDRHYEFIVGNHRYSGRIHEEVYRDLLRRFASQNKRIHLSISGEVVENVCVSVTRDGDRPVFFLTWQRKSCANKAAEKKRSSVNSEEVDAVTQTPFVDEEPPQSVLPTTQKEIVSPKCTDQQSPTLQNKQKNVILVDDDDRFRLILRRILESKGWSVWDSPSSATALEYLAENSCRIHLAISDVHMPNIDGAAFLRKVKELKSAPPVLMLTSDDNSLLEAELAMLGADAFVRKQEDPRVLLAWCNNLFSRRSMET